MNMYRNIFFDNNINGDIMNLNDIITKKIIVGNVDDTIFAISELMRDFDIGCVPIAENNKIIGIITDRDIVINCIGNSEFGNAPIKSYITRKIISIGLDQTVEQALNMMGEHKIKRLLITNDEKVVGILSLSDIVNNFNNIDLIVESFKKIYEIKNNSDYFTTKVNEFTL